MSFPRLAAAAAVLALLAACDNSPKPPPQQPAAPATTAPASGAAPAAAPAATPAAAPQAAAAGDATAPLMGRWSADPATCGSADITITATRFEGAQNQCDITALTDKGDGSFNAAMSCGSAGTQNVNMRPLFAPSGEAIGLTWIDRGNEQTTVYRCGPAQ